MTGAYDPPSEREDRDGRIDDPEDYLLSRRFRQIMDARERFSETIRERKDDVDPDGRSGITQGRYRELVADALVEYLIEIEPILCHQDLAEEVRVWDDALMDDPSGEPITLERIVGDGGVVIAEDGGEVPLPVNVSRRAFRRANQFLADVGFGVRVDQGLPSDDHYDATRHRGRDRDSDLPSEEPAES